MFSLKGSLLVLCGLLNIITVPVLCDSDDIIVEAKLNCSSTPTMARINVLSDAQLKAKLYCLNNTFTYTMGENQVSLSIPLSMNKSRLCQLKFVPETRTYEAVMSLYRIIRNIEEPLNTYRVICEMDSMTSGLLSVGVNNPFQKPQIIEHYCNGHLCDAEVKINLDLEVRNIFGKKLNNLTVLRKVQLYTNVTTNFTGKGIQARECIMKTDEELMILKGGCGTGFFFSKNVGFETQGNSVTSQYFLIPPIVSPTALFSCTFRVCSSKCDGNSCVSYPSPKISNQTPAP